MKTATQIFSLMTVVIFISMPGNILAQGRGHHGNKHAHKHEKNHRGDEHDRRHHWKDDGHDHHTHYREDRWHDHHDRRTVRHVVHHHDKHCDHVVVRHYQQRPRYIYYRDYDVYYDLRRDVYITWSGRNWSVTTSLPVILHRVDVRHTVRMEVDYDDDDFPAYLETRRPAYRRVYAKY